MNRLPQIRVVFFLALGLARAAAAGFGPLATPIQLPEALRQRPIWQVARLPSGELAVGHAGGLTLGFPGGTWQTVAAPGGQTVQVVHAAHDRILVAGSGFSAFLQGATLQPIAGMAGEYYAAEAVPEGWLLAGSDGVWWITPTGIAQRLARPAAEYTGRQPRVFRMEGDVWVSLGGFPPRRWRDGRIEEAASDLGVGDAQVAFSDGGALLTTKGLIDRTGRALVPLEVNRALLREGIVGLARIESQVMVATFSGGLSGYDFSSGAPRWAWRSKSAVYGLARDGAQFLLGTGAGALALADPVRVAFWPMEHVVVQDLSAAAEGRATIVTVSGSYEVGDNKAEALGEIWSTRAGAVVKDGVLQFGDAREPPRSRFVTGLAALPSVAMVSRGHEVVVLFRSGESRVVALDGLVTTLATDDRFFYAATELRGVQVISRKGEKLRQIDSGRAQVRELCPGRVVLLFANGSVRDAEANLLGRIEVGAPTDAALVPEGLAILVVRPDRAPVVGVLAGDSWRPMEVPGLAEIGAEKIAASASHFFAAGPRGVVRVQLPLVPAVPPKPEWRWSHPVHAGEVQLDDAAVERVTVAVMPGELSPAAATHFRVRVGQGAWAELAPGAPVALAVAAGRTAVELEAERNGRVTTSQFTVVRPHPWWLRAWAWPLHGLALAGVVVGLVRWRTRRLNRLNRELEARVATRTAELRQANAVKEEFLASISHEIRNPLNGVVGICEMLAERSVGPREHVLVRTLGGCADQLRSMLDDILEFSQLERARPALTNSDFELLALVDECARVMDPDLAACSLLLPDRACWLHGDSGKIRQVVCNLISNALKYGVPREAGIEVQVTPVEAGRVRVRLAVRNTGTTIPAEEMPLLFESFRRGSQTGGVPGSGLGLAVCRRLSRAMGGHLTAASRDGLTEFAFEVVLASAQPPVRSTVTMAPVSRALAVEDEDYNRLVLGHVLRSLGYAVDWAEDAASALRLAATHPYDLVLTDWRLPDMQGGELCQRLLAILPEPQPPIVAVTAYASAEKLAEAKAVGMAGFVTKPVTREKLERAIRGMASGRQPRRSLDAETPGPAVSPLASLGGLAPSPLELAANITERWRSIVALSSLQDPRTGREAHALRGLLLLAGEQAAAEQLGLLEGAVDRGDWDAVSRLRVVVNGDVAASEARLRG